MSYDVGDVVGDADVLAAAVRYRSDVHVVSKANT